MHTLWTILGGVGIALALVVLLALTKPNTFTVERRTTIHVPADAIFGMLNDFHHWPKWSPWEQLDPAMTRTHSGAGSGVGAVYAWTGNSKVGEGRMEILHTTPNSRIDIKLDFIRPFKSQNTATYTLAPRMGGIEVVWSMVGPMLFVSKVMSVFVSMDKMIGKDFERGLWQLKAELER